MENNQTPPVVESASGTTSRSNQDSGHIAYAIVAMALVAGILLTQRLFTSLADVIDIAEAELSDSTPMEELSDLGRKGGPDGLTTSPDYGGSKLGEKDEEVLTVAEALDHDIATYDLTIDSLIDATEYSGVPADVTGSVRAIVRADADASGRIVRCLRAAAREGEDPDARLADAIEACDDQIASLEEASPSDVAGLDEAREKVAIRWQAIRSEIELVRGGALTEAALDEADQQVAKTTMCAADALADVLRDAAR